MQRLCKWHGLGEKVITILSLSEQIAVVIIVMSYLAGIDMNNMRYTYSLLWQLPSFSVMRFESPVLDAKPIPIVMLFRKHPRI